MEDPDFIVLQRQSPHRGNAVIWGERIESIKIAVRIDHQAVEKISSLYTLLKGAKKAI